MASIDTKYGRVYVGCGQKERALNLGVESRLGSGFVSIPLRAATLRRVAPVALAALALGRRKKAKSKKAR